LEAFDPPPPIPGCYSPAEVVAMPIKVRIYCYY